MDFGAESCIPLIREYDNLLVTQTFSKSRSMAGMRLGFGVACEALIRDLKTVQYSTNPYNVNRMTQAAGVAAAKDTDYYLNNCRIIQENRAYTVSELEKLGFEILPSKANFIFARTDRMAGGDLYRALKRDGVLVRHFDKESITDYLRISIGTRAQMDILLSKTRAILEQEGN